jgi:hypothetical protein
VLVVVVLVVVVMLVVFVVVLLFVKVIVVVVGGVVVATPSVSVNAMRMLHMYGPLFSRGSVHAKAWSGGTPTTRLGSKQLSPWRPRGHRQVPES